MVVFTVVPAAVSIVVGTAAAAAVTCTDACLLEDTTRTVTLAFLSLATALGVISNLPIFAPVVDITAPESVVVSSKKTTI